MNVIMAKCEDILSCANPSASKVYEALWYLLHDKTKGTTMEDFNVVAECVAKKHPEYLDAFFDILFFNIKFI